MSATKDTKRSKLFRVISYPSWQFSPPLYFDMTSEELFMKRCIELALNGSGNVAPNPLVGCVIVYDDKIIGEGFHQEFGKAHAEVNAIESVTDKTLLSKSTLYVSLEPCSHHGKTPPCVDLIIKHKIPHVVIGCADTFSEVNGKGIAALKNAGIKVTLNVLEEECRNLNKRFFTYHEKKRPYIILKWAQSKDGFIGKRNVTEPVSISNEFSKTLSHKWRSEEAAIMIGTNTAIADNPQLNTRLWNGKNPLRIAIDKDLKTPSTHHLFSGEQPTLIFNAFKNEKKENTEFIKIGFSANSLKTILNDIYKRQINSVIVEGGTNLLSQFIEQNLWDEARVFTSPVYLKEGIPTPVFNFPAHSTENIMGDQLQFFYRTDI